MKFEVTRAEAREAVRQLISFLGDDPERPGLLETPDRVIRSYRELFAGYDQDPKDVFKTFDGEKYDEIIVSRSIHFASTCEHHLLPFLGVAHVAYLPNGKIVGLSKLARLVDIYARRLQVQERMTTQVTDALIKYLDPRGAACIVIAKHLCQSCRGVQKQDSDMVTSSLTGVFKEDLNARSELFRLLEVS